MSGLVYFNDNEPYVAEWLKNLYPKADVDGRSITEVKPQDLTGYTRVHTFAGIGGWQLALNMAGWGDTPVWTASLPCQPFSTAGKRKGESDERHLWPVFRQLVADCLPPVIFGEQVASKDGKVWLSRVRADLEALGYGVGAADLCAAGVGAPHIRQRLYWVAARVGGLAHAAGLRLRQEHPQPAGSGERGAEKGWATGLRSGGTSQRLADAVSERGRSGQAGGEYAMDAYYSSEVHPNWARFDLIPGLDGKIRRIEPGTPPVAHGVSARGGRLRAYGNAIVPPLAAEFVSAFMECTGAY